MQYEVEQKFPVVDLSGIESRLLSLGAAISQPCQEWDLYFRHPARNFAQTDEALRIRRKQQAYSITYKGPKIDQTTKTRREIELPLGDDEHTAGQWIELLKALGFSPLAEVRKWRRKAVVHCNDRRVAVSLDQVEQLGAFVELELVVGSDELEPAKAAVASLAEQLGLRCAERRSYLELLLDRRPEIG